MKLSCLLQAIPTLRLASPLQECDISGASPDSRLIREGMLFCAMKGTQLDGHQFIPQALANGASVILAEHPVSLPSHIPLILMDNAYETLGRIAELFADFPAKSLSLLAVTGTNGKTTTAYLLRAILKNCEKATGMIGTIEYDLGNGHSQPADRTTPMPFQLQSLFSRLKDNGATYTAIELSSHALEQGRLGTARCSCAIFTNLTQDHLDYHHTMENYYQAKKLLFTRYLAPGSPVIINMDDPYGQRLFKELPSSIGYSFNGLKEAPIQATNLILSSQGSQFTLHFPDGSSWETTTPLPGKYNAANVAGAVCAAYALHLPKENVLKAIQNATGAPGRMQPIPVPGKRFSLFVDYAHTDDALTNALTCLKQLPHRRLIVLFGCGGDRDKTKRPKMAAAAAQLADQLIITSDNPRSEDPNAIIHDILTGLPPQTPVNLIPDRKEAIEFAIQNAASQDILLLAGKGHENTQEIQGTKIPFNDAAVAREALQKRFGHSSSQFSNQTGKKPN